MKALGGGETLTPRERVRLTFARQEADRVPIDYSSNPGIDSRLKEYFGLAPDDWEGLRQALGVDFRGVGAPYVGPPLPEPIEGRHVDIWGCRTRWVEHPSGGYWDYCDFPLSDADEETVANWPMPSPDDFDYSTIAAQCEAHAQYALHAGGAGTGDTINSTGFVRGTEQVLVDLITDDPAGLLLTERRVSTQLEIIARTLEAAKGRIDFLWLGEDLGTQRGPIISVEIFRKHIRPKHQRFVDLAKSYGIPVMIHCCGSSSWAFDDFAEMGIGVVDTLQPEAWNMAPAYLKATYGDRLAFHGCISTAGVVSFGTPEQVVGECEETLEVMMPGGGYCFAPTHCFQDNSPTENVVAAYETAHRAGKF
jgi:uroporphyrinogen decarboxylase